MRVVEVVVVVGQVVVVEGLQCQGFGGDGGGQLL